MTPRQLTGIDTWLRATHLASKRKALDKSAPIGELMDKLEQTDANIQAEVELRFG